VTRDARGLSTLKMKSHQRGMRGISQRINDESLFEGADCTKVVATVRQNPAKARQRIDTQCGKPPTLQFDPLLKGCFAQRQAVEQCSAIECRHMSQVRGIVTLRGAKELAHIHIDRFDRKTDAVSVGYDCVFPERPPERCQRLAKAVSRLGLGAIAPEKIEYPVTRHAAAQRQRKHSQQGFCFSGRQCDPAARGIECLEWAEQID
jgi:hypothetical protein